MKALSGKHSDNHLRSISRGSHKDMSTIIVGCNYRNKLSGDGMEIITLVVIEIPVE